mmetsp:Transcript_12548/g.23230  ORF Transcript_12548/g.23230 Transcript_12548/m.23230 type:complete len:88 (+) Transcript_12548:228-491(+)
MGCMAPSGEYCDNSDTTGDMLAKKLSSLMATEQLKRSPNTRSAFSCGNEGDEEDNQRKEPRKIPPLDPGESTHRASSGRIRAEHSTI